MSDDEKKILALLEQLRRAEGDLPTGIFGRFRRLASVGARLALKGRFGFDLDAATAAAMARSFGELKALPMKIGQILSYIDATMPPEVAQILGLLRTQSPSTPFETVAGIIRSDLKERAGDLLRGIDPDPVSSASIGQVHKARLPGGETVAVKVLHPSIREAILTDFRAAGAGRRFVWLLAPGGNVNDLIAEAEAGLLEECDYSLEADRQERFAAWFAKDPVIVVPRVHREWCGPRVLVTDWIDGADWEAFLGSGPPQRRRDEAGEALYRFFMGTLYRRGVLAADPHPGNFLFLPEGRVAVLDYGCVREYGAETASRLRDLSRAVRADDAKEMQAGLSALGARLEDAQEDDLEKARSFLRSFLGPALAKGRKVVRAGASLEVREVLTSKRAMLRLNLPPGRLIFLLRIRFGLYAVLERLGARCDWAALEADLADQR
jgi:predicted unusual protein kinase regulating ubiquinone biosynthesis (AarF/ABC1/UbiB family)